MQDIKRRALEKKLRTLGGRSIIIKDAKKEDLDPKGWREPKGGGKPYNIDTGTGEVLAGMGNKHTGEKISQIGKTSKNGNQDTQKSQTAKSTIGTTATGGEGIKPTVMHSWTPTTAGELLGTALSKPVQSTHESVQDDIAQGKNVTSVTTNLGNTIDVTPASKHSVASGNPFKGEPNSSTDILGNDERPSTHRWFDENGSQIKDVDFTDHKKPQSHPEVPHEHGSREIEFKEQKAALKRKKREKRN